MRVRVLILLFSLIGLTLMNVPFVVASPSYEDFTSFTEIGDTGDMLFQNVTHANWTYLDRNYDTWIYKDYGVDYFGDFEHLFDFEVTELEAGDGDARLSVYLHILAKTNVASNPADALILFVAQIGSNDVQFQLTFFQLKGSVSQFSSSGFCTLDVGTKYYAEIFRNGTTCRCIIYSDAERTVVVGDTGDQTGVSDSYRYLQATKGIDSSNDPDDWSSGYVTNLYFIVPYYVTFCFNEGGLFRVDNATVSNGTVKPYPNGTVVELASLPQNSSYIWLNFTWDSSSALTNPYDLVVTSNATVWCYFSVLEAASALESYFLAFGFVMFTVAAAIFILRRKNGGDEINVR